jgi:hypothetical protein
MKYVWAAVKTERRRLNREIPLEVLVVCCYQTGLDPAGLRDSQEIGESLLKLIKRLPQQLRRVLMVYYGLNGGKPQTLRVIGEQMGLSGERVRQLRNEALIWLRQPAHSQELRGLLRRHNQQQYELADQLAQVWLCRRGGRHARL